MRTTMDKAGRLVIPRQVRQEMGLPDGGEVDVSFRDGAVEIELAPVDVRLVERDGFLAAEVADPGGGGPEDPMTDEDVRDLLERGRR